MRSREREGGRRAAAFQARKHRLPLQRSWRRRSGWARGSRGRFSRRAFRVHLAVCALRSANGLCDVRSFTTPYAPAVDAAAWRITAHSDSDRRRRARVRDRGGTLARREAWAHANRRRPRDRNRNRNGDGVAHDAGSDRATRIARSGRSEIPGADRRADRRSVGNARAAESIARARSRRIAASDTASDTARDGACARGFRRAFPGLARHGSTRDRRTRARSEPGRGRNRSAATRGSRLE